MVDGTTKCKWDIVIPFDKLWEQYERIIKDNGVIILFGSEPFSSELRMSNKKIYKYDLKWQKEQGVDFLNAKRKPLTNYEDIMIFYKIQPTYNPQFTEAEKEWKKKDYGCVVEHLGRVLEPVEKKSNGKKRYPLSIIKFNRPRQKLHPTAKPIELMEYLINTYTNESDTVLDNCMGSGSTGVACMNTNRKFIGIELDENYFNIAKERIKEVTINDEI